MSKGAFFVKKHPLNLIKLGLFIEEWQPLFALYNANICYPSAKSFNPRGAILFYKMSNLKSAIAGMPRAIARNDQPTLTHIHRLVVELLMHLDEEKKEKDRAKRENAQPIVEEIDKVLQKYRIKKGT